jgi:hypothetical protein
LNLAGKLRHQGVSDLGCPLRVGVFHLDDDQLSVAHRLGQDAFAQLSRRKLQFQSCDHPF